MWVSGVMVALEFLDVGMNTVNKAAFSKGMSQLVLVTYSNFIGFFLLLSICLLFYRKRTPPPLTRSIIFRLLVLGAISCCGQELTYIGIRYSSPTMASAMTDLTPAFTFMLAVLLRLEILSWRIKSSRAKFIGTIMLIAGGLVVTLYKGLPLMDPQSSNTLVLGVLHLSPSGEWIMGGFLLATHSLILAAVYVLQTWIIRDFPAELLVTLSTSTWVTILSFFVSLIAERDLEAWKISPDIELTSVVYTAAFAVTLRTAAHTWACHKKGPVFACMFKPLGMVIAVLMGVTFLGDVLYLGSLVGAAIIALGFYSVIWGQAREEKMMVKNNDSWRFESSSQKDPLLQNGSTNV